MYQFGYQQWVVFWQENALELVSNDMSHISFTVLPRECGVLDW